MAHRAQDWGRLVIEAPSWEVGEITEAKHAQYLIQRACVSGECAIDTETTGVKPFLPGNQAFMTTFCAELGMTLACYDPQLTYVIMEGLLNNKIKQVYHYSQFDLHMIRNWTGWRPPSYLTIPMDDTLQGFRVQFEGDPANLKIASKRYCEGVDVDGPQHQVLSWLAAHRNVKRINGKWVDVEPKVTFQSVPKDIMLPYATQDAWLTLKSNHGLIANRANRPAIAELYEREVRLCKLLTHVELRGWDVDSTTLMELMERARLELDKATKDFSIIAPHINPYSPKQLVKYIYTELGEPVKYLTEKGKPATEEAALAALNNVVVGKVLRDIRHWKRTFDKCREIGLYLNDDGAVHSRLKPERARTGRFGSTEPALQNISNYVKEKPWTHTRSVFSPRPGTEWLLADYSQIEMRIFAHYSRDPYMVDAILHDADLHAVTASRMYGLPPGSLEKQQRNFGKLMNFTIIYGGGQNRVKETLLHGMPAIDPLLPDEARKALRATYHELNDDQYNDPHGHLAAELLKTYRREFPTVTAFLRRVGDVVRSRGYVINAFGRELPLPPERAHVGVNTLVQSSAADLMKSAMLTSWAKCEEYCEIHHLQPWTDLSLFMTIHDELIFSIPIGHAESLASYIRPAFIEFPQFEVPINVDFAVVRQGNNWATKEKLN